MPNPISKQIAQFIQLAGISTNISSSTLAKAIEAYAAQVEAVTPTDMLYPTMIYTINQLLASFPSLPTDGFVYAGNYGSAGPQFVPPSNGALAIDEITRRQWQYSGGAWT